MRVEAGGDCGAWKVVSSWVNFRAWREWLHCSHQSVDERLLCVGTHRVHKHHGVDEQLILPEIEVCELHVSFHVEENVHGFEVAVGDVQVVKVFDRQEDFRSVGPAAVLTRTTRMTKMGEKVTIDSMRRTARSRKCVAARHLLDETSPSWLSLQP